MSNTLKKPKKTTTYRTCPECGSRATKIFNLNSGKYKCQCCDHEYEFGVPTALRAIL